MTVLVGDGKGSSGPGSDGSGSLIESEPSNLSKLVISSVSLDVEVSDSQSVLAPSNVLGLIDVLACVHLGSDVE